MTLGRMPGVSIPVEVINGIRKRTGLAASDRVALGVRRSMARIAVTDPLEYEDLLDSDPEAFDALITELTVGETYFLRESGQFDFVVREVLPDLRGRARRDLPLNAWSAGCAAGEEAYSLAIAARESQPDFAMRVLGTDIAESRLAVARKAVYGEWSLRGVPEKILERYFRSSDHRVKVVPEIRSMVEFRFLNLVDADWTAAGIRPGSMDLIFCRNVLIYLDAATIVHIARRLMESLRDGGWLFLGASDPALAGVVDCDVVVTGAGIAYRRGGTAQRLPSRAVTATELAASRANEGKCPEFHHQFSGANALVSDESSAVASPRHPRVSLPARGKVLHDSAPLLDQAISAYRSGDYLRAAEIARDVVAIDRMEPKGWIVLVRSLANVGGHEEACLASAAGLDINRTSPELTYMHAMLLRHAGKNTEALKALRCAVYLDRNFVVAHLGMGDVLLALGDREAARRAFRISERLLSGVSDSQAVPGADGLDAGRLRAVVQMQLGLLARDGAQ